MPLIVSIQTLHVNLFDLIGNHVMVKFTQVNIAFFEHGSKIGIACTTAVSNL